MEKCIIVAVADNGAIGRKNQLLWNLPGDMKYFRETTTGHTVIMGWMTFQSIGRALPRRTNIVISEFPWPDAPSTVHVVPSLADGFVLAEKLSREEGLGSETSGHPRPDKREGPIACDGRGRFATVTDPIPSSPEEKCFVIGGAYTYRQAMETADTLYITHVHDTPADADVFFPEIDPEIWKESSREAPETDPETGISYEFTVYRRK